MVLIPKKLGATAVDAFRPICLQNCTIKIIAKTLTCRLQREIGNLIDLHQTGFLQGRSISETFVFAAEIVQACNKRKVPTLVLKLDFAKAFDTVNWTGLDQILSARGFSPTWRRWMKLILESSKSAILLNGVPGPWINCKRGLRQGDPLSPYLFLLVADTLQALIRSFADEIGHPIVNGAGCVTLQYADDTLIVLKGDLAGVLKLKEALNLFSEATGLTINYHKSTLVPLHMDSTTLQMCIDTFGCKVESFPQNYLGLPLSTAKLPASVFNSYIDRTDSFLSSWQASFLNTMGRVVLINSVLDSQLVYVMSALCIPPTVIQQVDKRRRAFMWSGEPQTSSAKCLVAWEKCCTTKDLGGLGIKDFGTQNICLLLKLIHRLHCSENSAWGQWVRQHCNLATLRGDLQGTHWDMLRSILPLYQALTTVLVRDGSATSFWYDVWHEDEALSERFPALFSHCKRKEDSIREAVLSNLHDAFVPRLSNQAVLELQQVMSIVLQTTLTAGNDRRKSQFDTGRGKLDSSSIYCLLKAKQHAADPSSKFIWKNSVPPRIQFFMWLLSKGRIQCRANLYRKKIVQDQHCEACGASEETTDHIILHCPFARDFWNEIGIADTTQIMAREIHEISAISGLPTTQYNTFIALCCWQLWKRRNALVFRNEVLSLRQILQACHSEADAWRPRLPRKQRHVVDSWTNYLQVLINRNM
jgi:hypothetical protein